MRPITHLFEVCILLLTMSFLFTLFGVIGYRPKQVCEDLEIVEPSGEIVLLIPTVTPTEVPEDEEPDEIVVPEALEVNQEFRRRIGEVELPATRLVFHNEYRIFLTAYCAEECGWNYYTSSGTYCHRANEVYRYEEPTTCAIDLRYFRYGTMFYVPSEDRIYIAEDTGPGVVGMWIDTYQDDMDDVVYYNTRYETVYTVSLEEYTVLSSNYDINKYIFEKFISKSIFSK